MQFCEQVSGVNEFQVLFKCPKIYVYMLQSFTRSQSYLIILLWVMGASLAICTTM